MHNKLQTDRSDQASSVSTARGEQAKVQQLDSHSPTLRTRIVDGFEYWLEKLALLPNLVKFAFDRCVEMLARQSTDATDGHLSSDSAARGLGVNVVGYFESEKGVGEAARASLRSLDAGAIPYTIKNVFDISAVGLRKSHYRSSRRYPYGFNLIHVNADLISRFARKNARFLAHRYNIGYWNWELSCFPGAWSDRFGCVSEVWVPSTFCLEAISKTSPIPVVRIPYSIDPNLSAKDDGMRARLGLSPGTFVFLFYFDLHSFMERKNPLALIRAFQKAFSGRDDAVLVIKCLHSKRSSRALLEDPCKRTPNIKIFDAVLTREALNSLLATCDAYVSLHRSEGFGLTLTEAMNLAKPVIATGYSANLDFMNETNGFLVKYKLVEIEKDYGPYKKGFVWAEPDTNHAAELMRSVYINRDQARAVGEQARLDIRQLLHPGVVGGMIRERLMKIEQSVAR